MIKNRLIVLCATLLVANSLNAQTTTCYKKSWENPSVIETTKLDGGLCNGEKSLKEMQRSGWYIKDIEIKAANKGLDYNYILSDTNPTVIEKEYLSKNNINEKISMNAKISALSNVTEKTATINIPNLKVGQSGIIEHRYSDGNTIIVSSAYVQSSNNNSSVIKFIPFLDLKQNAIPTSNRKVSSEDRFILNYMYDQSLLITPNIDAFRYVRNNFQENNFMHSDIFGSYLKSQYRPLPSKKIIQEFAIEQNLGTIFIAIKSDLYIVDAKTFTVLSKEKIANVSKNTQMPFYTRIEKIESNLLTTDFWDWINFSAITEFFEDNRTEDEILYGDLAKDKSKDEKADYNTYYSNILGLNNDKQ